MISDEEYRERLKALAGAIGTTTAEFGESMQRLNGTLAASARNIGALGAETELQAEVAQLAAESIYSREQWRAALLRIGHRPDRLEIARLCGEAAARGGETPDAVAALLVGDETTPGLLAAYIGP